jgi:6-methylsalicylate decarboxylase
VSTAPDGQGRIDVHHHALPPAYLQAMRAAGVTRAVPGVTFPHWDLDTDLEVLDRHGIATAILSITTPGLSFAQGKDRRTTARAVNENLAEIARSRPGRYGAFAVLPVPDVAATIAEIDYALDELGLDGAGLFSNADGLYPGDPALDAVIGHLAERDVVTFVHPAAPPGRDQPTFGLPASLFEFAFETTRVAANLLYSGTLERRPGWRVILAHAGGATPYLAQRLTYGSIIMPGLQDRQPADAIAALKGLYYDTAISASPYALPSLAALAKPSHIVFGTDYPFMPEGVLAETVTGVESFYSGPQLAAVERGNAAKMFVRQYRGVN